MKEFIELIVKYLVDNPDQVDVKEVEGSRTTVYELRVAQPDLGKVIGKQGQTAKSIRTLLAAAAARQGKRAVLEILE
ncbi:MAG TPA: KH domain-containing protein [candidate division Zixibacteria bacterium]|nr:KH domain-containing protein [candidate division Zixibacteria bacterium]